VDDAYARASRREVPEVTEAPRLTCEALARILPWRKHLKSAEPTRSSARLWAFPEPSVRMIPDLNRLPGRR
jgi:hypothetical protein